MKRSNVSGIFRVGCLLVLAGACSSTDTGAPMQGGVGGGVVGPTAGTAGDGPVAGTTGGSGTGGVITAGTGGGAGTGVVPMAGSDAPPAMCSTPGEPVGTCANAATGIFAIKTVVDVWWKDDKNNPPLVDPGRDTITVYLKGKLSDVCADGSGGTGEITACGTTLPPFKSDANCDAFQITFPDDLWDKPGLPKFTTTGSTTGFEPGDILTLAEATGLLGINLADRDGAWPQPAMTAMLDFPDHDEDQKPGITIVMGRIGETFNDMGKCGIGGLLDFVFRGAPTDALGALDDNGVKAETLYIGLRTRIGGGGAIGSDCASGVGDSKATFLDSRVADCLLSNDMPCTPAQAMFVDNAAPNYHILNKGEKPPLDVTKPLTQGGGPLDQTPGLGSRSAIVRLGDLGTDFKCAAIRGAAFPAL